MSRNSLTLTSKTTLQCKIHIPRSYQAIFLSLLTCVFSISCPPTTTTTTTPPIAGTAMWPEAFFSLYIHLPTIYYLFSSTIIVPRGMFEAEKKRIHAFTRRCPWSTASHSKRGRQCLLVTLPPLLVIIAAERRSGGGGRVCGGVGGGRSRS